MNSLWHQSFNLHPTQYLAALALAAAITGCGRDEIKVYRVAKQPPARMTLPEGWTAVPPGPMRVASFTVKGDDGKQADMGVIPLPGAAGGVLANVNRWRSQVALPPATEAEVNQMAEPVLISGQPAELYDVAGTNASSGRPERILATIQNRDGVAWFFKMTGDANLVAQQKPAFIAFLKTFDATAARALPVLPTSHPPIDVSALPPGHPEVSTVPAPGGGETSRAGQPKWEVPSGWKEVPGGQFLIAKFILSGDAGGQAAVNVSSLAGDGGGLAANVNRWREQLGLAKVAADEDQAVKTIETFGGKASVVELSGTDAHSGQPTSLLAAIVPQPGQTWFYKLMGDAKVVEAQKDEFMKFVQSVKY